MSNLLAGVAMVTRDSVTVMSFLCYTLTFSIGGLVVAWSLLPPVAAVIVSLLSVLFWPLWLSMTLLGTPEPRVFTGQIDHPGGGIGVVIALCVSFLLVQSGSGGIAFISFILGIPVLGISFSLISEWLECQITNLRFQRSERSNPSRTK